MLKDSQRRMIKLSDQVSFSMSTDESYISILDSSSIGDLHIVKALKERKNVFAVGQFKGLANLNDVETPFDFNIKQLKHKQEIHITKAIKIVSVPNEIILPYLGYFIDSDLPAKQMWIIDVIGGSGDYHWTSSEQSVATVSSSINTFRNATLKGNNIGTTTITVSDK